MIHICWYVMHNGVTISVRSPPPCGEGLGVGVVADKSRTRSPSSTAPPPSPTLPHKGGGSRPSPLVVHHVTDDLNRPTTLYDASHWLNRSSIWEIRSASH